MTLASFLFIFYDNLIRIKVILLLNVRGYPVLVKLALGFLFLVVAVRLGLNVLEV